MASNDSEHPVIIGISSYLEHCTSGVWSLPAVFLPQKYVDAITSNGASVVVLPVQNPSPSIAANVVSRIDGLIISGGADINPSRYGQEPHEKTQEARNERDEWELALIRAALERNLPTLGICRGAQLLNVSQGGTLEQHLPDVVGSEKYQPSSGVFGAVDVHFESKHVLSELFSTHERTTVPVYHHQAISTLGKNVRTTARTDENVIEAIELTDKTFAIGIQWHPEQQHEDQRLFRAFIDAARTNRSTL